MGLYNLVLHVSGRLGVISMPRKEFMTVLSEEGSDRKSYTKDRNNIKMLIISHNLKLVPWTSYLAKS